MQLRFLFNQSHPGVELVDDADGAALNLRLTNQLVSGPGIEHWPLPGAGQAQRHDDFLTWRNAEAIAGAACVPVDDENLESVTYRLYTQMLALSKGYVLHRFWNFVPHINASVGELDRYMCFCVGRANALADHEIPLVGRKLPPASAVGTSGNHLCVAFLAGSNALSPVENPLQVPAYEYPQRYGPRSPSFARAGLISNDPPALMISGTASIRGSESLHVGDFERQAQTALENLLAVSEAAGHADWLSARRDHHTCVRVYIRTAHLWQTHATWLEQNLLEGIEQFNVIQADICRSELLVEIEACTAR